MAATIPAMRAPTVKMCACGKSAMPYCVTCEDCLHELERVKQAQLNVPYFGSETTRLSGRTGTCPVCGKRGCMSCEKKPWERR